MGSQRHRLAHGAQPALEGKNLLHSPDADNNPVVAYVVRRLIEVAKSDKKEGVTTYRIPKSGQKLPLEKIAYSRLFEPWGWSIGTGAYVDDIDDTFRARAFSVLWLFVGLIVLAGAITYVIGADLTRALHRLATRTTSFAKGELDGDVPDVERTDEVGIMARSLMVLRDTSREAAELRLDQLMGLPTRKLLMDRLKQVKGRSARSGNYAGLLLVDLDGFKALNDTHGHDVGDAMLREIGQRLTASLRDGDTVARLGGGGTLQRSIPADQPSCVIERSVCASKIVSVEFLDTTGSTGSTRRGFTARSTYMASCRRSIKICAARAPCRRTARHIVPARSVNTCRTMLSSAITRR